MKNAPTVYTLTDLHDMCNSRNSLAGIEDKDTGMVLWVPARPLGFYSIGSRIKAAWLVFTGKADAVIWPGNQ